MSHETLSPVDILESVLDGLRHDLVADMAAGGRTRHGHYQLQLVLEASRDILAGQKSPTGNDVANQDGAAAGLLEHMARIAARKLRETCRQDVLTDHIDDMVHDVHEEKAIRINANGRDAQCVFLGLSGQLEDRRDLSERVMNACSSEASDLNNQGLEAQLEALFSHGTSFDEVLSDLPYAEPEDAPEP